MKPFAIPSSVALLALALVGSVSAQVTSISQPSKFPIEIASRGSYRFVGNLRVSSANVTAINFTAKGPVTIDLNGFAILGPAVCGGSPTTCTPIGTGVGIMGASQSVVSVFNGTISGLGGAGILLGSLARVRDVDAIGNGGGGIAVGANSVVTQSSASDNGSDGIAVGASSVVSGCSASGNGGAGINGALGVIVSASTAGANKNAGIVAETVTGSSADNNGANGITAATVEASTAESNTLTGIMAVTTTDSTAQFNLAYGFGGGLLINSSANGNKGLVLRRPRTLPSMLLATTLRGPYMAVSIFNWARAIATAARHARRPLIIAASSLRR